jgi:predicted nucleic acid-binding protein
MIVVDASAIVEMILRTRVGKRVEERLLAGKETLHAPHLLDVEVLQVLRRCVRTKELDVDKAWEALGDLRRLPLGRHAHGALTERVFELRDNMTAYDATYVALAEALDATLVTCDAVLARSPGSRVVVEVVD